MDTVCRILLVSCSSVASSRDSGSKTAIPVRLASLLDSLPASFSASWYWLPPHPATLGPHLGHVHGFDTLDTRSVYSKFRHLIRYEVPRTKAKTGIRVGRLVRKGKDSSSSSRYAVILGPGTFEEIPTEAKAWIGVINVQLVVTKLTGEPTRHIRLQCAGVLFPKHQIPRLDVY